MIAPPRDQKMSRGILFHYDLVHRIVYHWKKDTVNQGIVSMAHESLSRLTGQQLPLARAKLSLGAQTNPCFLHIISNFFIVLSLQILWIYHLENVTCMKSTLDMFSYYEGLTALIASCDQIPNYSTIRLGIIKSQNLWPKGCGQRNIFYKWFEGIIIDWISRTSWFGVLISG